MRVNVVPSTFVFHAAPIVLHGNLFLFHLDLICIIHSSTLRVSDKVFHLRVFMGFFSAVIIRTVPRPGDWDLPSTASLQLLDVIPTEIVEALISKQPSPLQ